MYVARKLVVTAGTAAALAMLGAGAALAATSGAIAVSTDGAKVTGGTFNFNYSGCRWGGGKAWDGYVAGTFVVTTANDHLNGKVDGFGWSKLVQGNAAKSYPFSDCLIARDVTIHDSISLQACREHWYGDDCHVTTKNR